MGEPTATELLLPPEPTSARGAREFVAERLAAAGYGTAAEVATLLVSELVTNAILHARSPICVRVRPHGRRVRVEVGDDSAAMPVLRDRDVDSTTGRGTLLVDGLAAAWGVEPSEAGKVVWFELATGV